MTVTVPETGTVIRFRWGEGMKLEKNFGGIDELLHPGTYLAGKFDWEGMF